MRFKKSDINHLRRLLGYVRCEIGQSPDEVVSTVRQIVDKTGEPSAAGKARLVQSHQKAQDVPKYVRAAVKALEKKMVEKGEIVDGEVESHEEIFPVRISAADAARLRISEDGAWRHPGEDD